MDSARPLDDTDIARFVRDGFVRVDGAFARDLAAAGVDLLWDEVRAMHPHFEPGEETPWPAPVVRLPGSGAEPFRAAATSPRLCAAFDQLVGPGRWVPRTGLGTFAIRFPHEQDPDDAGWHIDGSFPGADGNWWVNHHSRGRALLMLFLFTDIGPDDAPTRIRVGSHLAVPRLLVPAGDSGVPFGAVVNELGDFEGMPLAYATGQAGDVYLCHPFLVHAADRHRGRTPRIIAQPGLDPTGGRLEIERTEGVASPVERALRIGLGLD